MSGELVGSATGMLPAMVDWNAAADSAIEQARAFERIKREMLDASDYDLIQGKRVPNQKGIAKLGIPCGHSTELISRDEHGDCGVRRAIVEDTAGKKELLYTVTVRVTDRWGRYREQSASYYDRKKDDHSNRVMAEKRASKKAAELLVGGVNAEDGETSAAHTSRQASDANALFREIYAEGQQRGLWTDRASLATFVATLPGCADAAKALTVRHGAAVQRYLKENPE